MKRQHLLVILDEYQCEDAPEPALERGIFFAKEMGSVLELVANGYSPAYPPAEEDGEEAPCPPAAAFQDIQLRLEQIAAPVSRQGLDVHTDVTWHRSQFTAVMDKVSRIRPDIVFKTTRHDTRLRRTLFNYTDWQLIRHCPCPLLLTKQEEAWETRRIAACVDPAHIYSQAETLDNVIIETARWLAYRLRAELHIFHSIELMPVSSPLFSHIGKNYAHYRAALCEKHRELLAALLRPYGIPEHRVHLVEGPPARTLRPFTEEYEISLVIMGAVSKGPIESVLIGNTAEKVLDDLASDILVVKSNPVEVKEPSLAYTYA